MMYEFPSKFALMGGFVSDSANNISKLMNVFVSGGLIEAISEKKPDIDFKIFDVAGQIIAPGFIDLHTHLREPGFEHKEDIESGGNAAAAGGFTTIFCMPNTKPVSDNVNVLRKIMKKAHETSPVQVCPVGAISIGLRGEELADFEAYVKEGVLAISDDGSSVQNEDLMKIAMKKARDLNLLVISHPENVAISKGGVMNAGELAKKLGFKGIPAEAENSIIERDIGIAQLTGARLHIAHVSTAKGIDLVRKAKKSGLSVTCEVTPHHLMLTEDAVSSLDPNTKMNPPLRTEKDRMALIDGIKDGVVDAIATDHAPHAESEKIDFNKAPFGVIGMETCFPVCYKLVEENHIGLARLIELMTTGPARIAGIAGGSLDVGAVANLTIIDVRSRYEIDSGSFFSKSRNTPFDGWSVSAKITCTIVNGKIVFQKNDQK